jgi:hypothetical protein
MKASTPINNPSTIFFISYTHFSSSSDRLYPLYLEALERLVVHHLTMTFGRPLTMTFGRPSASLHHHGDSSSSHCYSVRNLSSQQVIPQ